MNLTDGRLAPAAGTDGLVSRVAGAVLFVQSRNPADTVASLVDLVAQHDGPTPARSLSRRLAAAVARDDDGALPGFALVAASDGGTYVQVYGSVEVRLRGDGTDEVLTGVGSFTGIDREINRPLASITVTSAGATAPEAAADLDLRLGTTFGDGFTLLASDGINEDATDAADATEATSTEASATGATVAAVGAAGAMAAIGGAVAAGAGSDDAAVSESDDGADPEPVNAAMAEEGTDSPEAMSMAEPEEPADDSEDHVDEVAMDADPLATDADAEPAMTEDASSSEADQIAAMNVVSSSASATPDQMPNGAVSPDGDSSDPTLEPTQAWSPDDMAEAAGGPAESMAATDPEPLPDEPVEEPGWGMAEATPGPSLAKSEGSMDAGPMDDSLDLDSEPLLVPPSNTGAADDQPSWYVPPVDAPTEAAEAGATDMMAPVDTGTEKKVEWDDLPVADDVGVSEPQPTEAATMAISPEEAAAVAHAAAMAGTPAPADDMSASAEAPGWGTAEPAMTPPAEVDFTSQLLGALDDEEVEERESLPVEPDPAQMRQADGTTTAEVQVQGVICSRGHFNDPRSRFCSSCGISMVQNTQVLTNGPRPPLGVIVFEDGATYSLSTDYVVGRQPDVHELVQQGVALPLPVDDPERSISRAHAELRLVEWDVHLVNLSGTNGSYVWDEHGQSWIPIPEGQSVVLTPGLRVALGRRSAVFESSLVR